MRRSPRGRAERACFYTHVAEWPSCVREGAGEKETTEKVKRRILQTIDFKFHFKLELKLPAFTCTLPHAWRV
jgi:hypothetical protein